MNQSATAVATLWSASIGKKAVAAVTGVVLVGFVVVHMLGNLRSSRRGRVRRLRRVPP
jgi:succinate dehydrogenase / fumarate reductase cytochrome b subunit